MEMKKIVENIGAGVICMAAATAPIHVSRADLVTPFFIAKELAFTQTDATGSLIFNQILFEPPYPVRAGKAPLI
jgi:hypothetical protein